MRRFLLDTNAVADWMNGRFGVDVRVREAKQNGVVVGTCELVVAELFFGMENSSSRESNLDLLNRSIGALVCWPLTRDASKEFGRIMAALRPAGRTVGPIDVMIAAIARTLPDCIVVSVDTDLQLIPGLKVENWRNA